MTTKAEFCKRMSWQPTAISLALGKIEWLDLTGLMELPNKNVAQIELVSRYGAEAYGTFEVTIINPTRGVINRKYFDFVDYLEAKDGCVSSLILVGGVWDWPWKDHAPNTRPLCFAIETYIYYFSK